MIIGLTEDSGPAQNYYSENKKERTWPNNVEYFYDIIEKN